LKRQIAEGALAPGYPVPSITTMTQETGYSRRTVGHAMRVLEDEGLLFRVPGLGYYVAHQQGAPV
jgi:DNA-binding GntR family transcriptional regulator